MISLDTEFKILKGVLRYWYGERLTVVYRQHSTLDNERLRADAAPLPAVAVDGEVIVRGEIMIQEIIERLTRQGVKRIRTASD